MRGVASSRCVVVSPLRLVWLVLHAAVLLSCCCDAQERPSLFVEKFDESVSYRTDVCDRQRALWNNSVEMPYALEGLSLSVVVTNYTGRDNAGLFSLDRNGRIPKKHPGLFVVIMDEVARRGKFTWRDNFGVASPLSEEESSNNQTWTDILLWGVETFDVSLEKWGYSLARLALQISFPVGYWDSSIVLVEHFSGGENTKQVMSWFAFLQPFHITTWVAIVAASIVTSLQFWFMERLNPNPEAITLETKASGSFYLAAGSFTGHYLYQPHNYSGYLLSVSLTCCTLTVALAYTANMASFLVAPTVTVFNYPNVPVVAQEGARLCIQANGVVQTLLTDQYPTLNFIPQSSEESIFTELRPGGECDVAAHQYSAFRKFERDKAVNYDCSLATNRQIVNTVPAGMATKVDTGGDKFGRCTSLISHVLDFHLNEMITDGFVDNAFENFLSRTGSITCIDTDSTTTSLDDPFALTLKDVGGLFLLHMIVTIIALGWGAFCYYVFPHVETHVKTTFNAKFNLNFEEESYQEVDDGDEEPSIYLIEPSGRSQRPMITSQRSMRSTHSSSTISAAMTEISI